MARISKYALALVVALAASNSVSGFSPVQPAFRRHAMQLFASVESTSTLTRLPDSAVEVILKVPGKATQAAYDKACFELSKTLVIPGFRKGARIPPQVLEQCMASKDGGKYALRVEAINSLLGQLIESALKDEHGLEPIGQPALAVPADELAASFVPGEDIELLVKCDVWPEIQWVESDSGKPYFGLTGAYARKPFNQEKMDKALSDLRERYATLKPTAEDSPLRMGDACRVDMIGFMANEDGTKGSPLPNAASGDNVEIVMGPGRYMEGLVEGIEGARVGDSRVVTVEFPMGLRDKSLAGKKAIFDVSILETSHRSLPEVTDEFANMVRPGLTAESLLEELKKAVDSEDAKEYVGARNAALSAALAKVMDVEVPDTLVTNQAREKFAIMMTEMRDNGLPDEEIKKQIKPENFLKYKKIVKDDIVRDFKVSMATDEIARMESIEVPDYQIDEQIENIKKDARGEEIDEAMIRGKVETTILRSLVFDFLAQNAKLDVKYETETFDEELMERLASESLERELKMAAESGGKMTTVLDQRLKEKKNKENKVATAFADATKFLSMAGEQAQEGEALAVAAKMLAEAAREAGATEKSQASRALSVAAQKIEKAQKAEAAAILVAEKAEIFARELVANSLERDASTVSPVASSGPTSLRVPIQPVSPAGDDELKAKYAAIEDIGERCFAVLMDLGLVQNSEEDDDDF